MKYKLKLTINGVEHLADLRFTDFIKNVFNHTRRARKNEGYFESWNYTLTENLTGEYVCVDKNEEEIEYKFEEVGISGVTNAEETGKSGVIKKIALVPRRFNSLNYNDESKAKDFLVSADAGYWEPKGFMSFDYDKSNDKILAAKMEHIGAESSIGLYSLGYKKSAYGLNGEINTNMAEGVAAANSASSFGTCNNCMHYYGIISLGRNTRKELYEYNKEQFEDYSVVDTILYFKTEGLDGMKSNTFLHDRDYCYFFEYFCYAPVRVCYYENEKPNGYDLYNKGSDWKFDKSNFELNNICHFTRIPKPHVEDRTIITGAVKLDGVVNSLNVSTEQFYGVNSGDEIYMNAVGFANTYDNEAIDAYLASATSDDNYLYLGGCFTGGRAERLYKLNKSQFEESTDTFIIEDTGIAKSEITEFCHTICIKNYYKCSGFKSILGYYGHGYSLINFVNKEDGTVDMFGFFLKSYTAFADFPNIEVGPNDTIKVEIIEEIEETEEIEQEDADENII